MGSSTPLHAPAKGPFGILAAGILLVSLGGTLAAQITAEELLEQDPRREILIPAVIRENMNLLGVDAADFDQRVDEITTRSGRYNRDELTQQAHSQSRELQQLLIQRNIASLEAASARSRRFPTVDMETSLTWIGNPLEPIVLSAGEFGSYEAIPGQETQIPPEDVQVWGGMESTLYDFKLIMDLPLFTWGKITNAVKLRRMTVEAADLQIEKKRRELETRIHILVNTLFYLEQMGLTLDLERAVGRRLTTLAEEGYDSGMTLPVDLMETRVKVKEIDLALRELEEQRSQILLDLRQTTGIDDLSQEQLDFTQLPAVETLTLPYPSDSLIQRALRENIDLMLLKKQEAIFDKKLSIAEGSTTFKPDIGFHSELSYSGQRFPFLEPDWFGKNRGNLTLTLAFQSPLFDAGQRETDRLISSQEQQKSRYSYQQGVDQIEQFIRQNELKRDLNFQRILYQKLKEESDTARMEQAKAEWEAGYGDESEFLKAQLDFHNNRIEGFRHAIDLVKNFYEVLNVLNLSEEEVLRKRKKPARATSEKTEPDTP